MTTFQRWTVAFFAALLIPLASGQEPDGSASGSESPAGQTGEQSATIELATGSWADRLTQQQETTPAQWLRLYSQSGGDSNLGIWMRGYPFASSDGQYAAQNEAEIKTYETLKMAYEFIERPYLRRQLQLKDDQGLFIVQADAAGAGYQLGFRDGDLVLRVDDTPVDTQYDFVIALTEHLGSEQEVEIHRDGEPQELVVRLELQGEDDKRYLLGVSTEEISELVKTQLGIESGVAVTEVTEGTAAAEVGLTPFDVIVAIDDQPIDSTDDLKNSIQKSGGASIDISLIRNGKKRTIEVAPRLMEERTPLQVRGEDVVQLFTPVQRANLSYLNPLLLHHQPLVVEHPEAPSVDKLDAILGKLGELEQKIDRLAK